MAPITFDPSSQPLANYDYVDIIEGTGTVNYNACAMTISAGTTYFLDRQEMYSDPIYTQATANGGASWVKAIDENFDILFNIPQTLKGKARVNITIGAHGDSGDGGVRAYVHLRLRHVDKLGAPTEIADARSDQTLAAGNGLIDTATKNIEINITKPAYFAAGEILRLTVEIWEKSFTGSGTGFVGFGHDPVEREQTLDNTPAGYTQITLSNGWTTKMNVHIPYRLDL